MLLTATLLDAHLLDSGNDGGDYLLCQSIVDRSRGGVDKFSFLFRAPSFFENFQIEVSGSVTL